MTYFQPIHWFLFGLGLAAALAAVAMRRASLAQTVVSKWFIPIGAGALALLVAMNAFPWRSWINTPEYSQSEAVGAELVMAIPPASLSGFYMSPAPPKIDSEQLSVHIRPAVHDFLSGSPLDALSTAEQLAVAVETLEALPHPTLSGTFEVPGGEFWRERLACERMLARGGISDAAALRAHLNHSNPVVRSAVASALAIIGERDSVPALLEQLAVETDRLARCNMAEAVLHLFQDQYASAVQDVAGKLPGNSQRLLKLCLNHLQDEEMKSSLGKWKQQASEPALWRRPEVGDQLADFETHTVHGTGFRLSAAVQSGPLLLAFITSDDCYMCDVYLDGILKREGVNRAERGMVCVVLPNSPRRVRAYAERFGLAAEDAPVVLLCDYESEIAARFGIARQFSMHGEQWCNPPAVFLIGAEMTVRWSHISSRLMDRATVFPSDL